MKKILLFTTGGTLAQENINGILDISNNKNSDFFKKYIDYNNIDIKELFSKDSSNIIQDDWNIIINGILENAEKYDGFIILHGTDTMAYSSCALALALGNIKKPILLTGGQIPLGNIGSDGKMNIDNCIRVINETDLYGVYLVFGSHIIEGTRVKKESELDYDAFTSFADTCIGRIGVKIKLNRYNANKYMYKYNDKSVNKIEFAMDKICVLNEFPSINKNIFKSLINSGIKAFIFRTYADGNLCIDELKDVIIYLKKEKIPLVIISQPDRGCTTMSNYSVGKTAKELGCIPAFDMTTEALTVKLGWLLGQNLNYNEIIKKLNENIRGEINIE